MNSVQQKISCVYVIGVTDQASAKRKQQTYKVTATKRLHAKSQADEIASAVPTEKLDGTCCLIGEFEGKSTWQSDLICPIINLDLDPSSTIL